MWHIKIRRSPQRGPFGPPPPWGSENGWKTSENISVKRIHDAHIQFLQRLAAGAKKSKWPPSAWFGHTNFFSMGDNAKILFSIMMFSYPDNSEKKFDIPGGPNGVSGPFWLILGQKWLFSRKFQRKSKFSLLFKGYFPSKN